MLLPLLTQTVAAGESSAVPVEEPNYSIAKMFTKKKKNTHCTPAQNYLLSVVRTSAKAAGIWNNPPLIRNLTAGQYDKFFETVFLMYDKLKGCRQLLTIQLSRTVINRRLFLHRSRAPRLAATPRPRISGESTFKSLTKKSTPVSSNSRSDSSSLEGSTSSLSTATSTSPGSALTSDSSESISTLSRPTLEPLRSTSTLLEFTSIPSWPTLEPLRPTESIVVADDTPNSDDRPHPGNKVSIILPDKKEIGKGIFLKMNSKEDYKLFSKVLFLSKKTKGMELISLPSESEQEKLHFNELEKGDIFLWKVSRLLPTEKSKSGSSSENIEELTVENTSMSEYEMLRMKRIQCNKQQFVEHMRQIATDSKEPPKVGEFVAVRCMKFKERPLIGCVTSVNSITVVTDWYVGSYSGTWKIWKGRENGKPTIFQEVIKLQDVLATVEFTKSMRLSPKTVSTLKQLYM